MLVTLAYLIGGLFLSAVTATFAALNYNPGIATLFLAVGTLVSYTGYFYGVIDLPRFFLDLGVVIGFETFWFAFLIVWYVIGLFRGLLTRSSGAH